MNKEIKDRWVAALRSGEYEQGAGLLAVPNSDQDVSYCCLGVLCELAVEAGVAERYVDGPRMSYGSENDRSDVSLPGAVKDWSGMKSRSGELPEPVKCGRGCCDGQSAESLAGVNDDLGFNFNQIADLIDGIYQDL